MRVPLRVRLTAAFAIGMAVILAGLGAFLYLRVGQDLLNGIDRELRSRAQVILGAVRSDPSLVRSSQGNLIDPDEAFAQILSPSGQIIDTSSGVAAGPMLDARTLHSVTGPTFVTTPVQGLDEPARLLAVPVGSERDTYVVVGADLGDRADALHRLLLELSIAGPAALFVVSFAGWLMAGSILGRLQESLQREKRFLDEASHELRTPLGVLKMELDLALSRARTPQELQDALRAASRETDRLVRLAEDLLTLSRTRDGTLPLHRQETSVGALLQRSADATRARADAAGVAIEVDSANGETALVDPERIRQAIDNLIDNALRYAGEGGRVTLSAVQADGSLHLSVRDGGAGFSEDVLHRASKPFARGEADRGAQRSGLGLAIVTAIAEAHGGTLRLENPEGGGALATLELPV